jgi:hypothetical protein
MARAKYLTDEQYKDIEADLDEVRKTLGSDLSRTGSWGDVRVIITYLHGNEAGTRRFLSALEGSVFGRRSGSTLHDSFIDDRVFRHGVRDGHKTIGTRDVLYAVKSLRATFPISRTNGKGKKRSMRGKDESARVLRRHSKLFPKLRKASTSEHDATLKRRLKKQKRSLGRSVGTRRLKNTTFGSRTAGDMARMRKGIKQFFVATQDKRNGPVTIKQFLTKEEAVMHYDRVKALGGPLRVGAGKRPARKTLAKLRSEIRASWRK